MRGASRARYASIARSRARAAGRARVLERFTWEAIADQTVALYGSLLA